MEQRLGNVLGAGKDGISPFNLSLHEMGNHTNLHHADIWVCSFSSDFPYPLLSSGAGKLIDAFSILLGGRWGDRQAARKSWWLLN